MRAAAPSESPYLRPGSADTGFGAVYVPPQPAAAARPSSPHQLLRRAFERAFHRPAPAGVRVEEDWDELAARVGGRRPSQGRPEPSARTSPAAPRVASAPVPAALLKALRERHPPPAPAHKPPSPEWKCVCGRVASPPPWQEAAPPEAAPHRVASASPDPRRLREDAPPRGQRTWTYDGDVVSAAFAGLPSTSLHRSPLQPTSPPSPFDGADAARAQPIFTSLRTSPARAEPPNPPPPPPPPPPPQPPPLLPPPEQRRAVLTPPPSAPPDDGDSALPPVEAAADAASCANPPSTPAPTPVAQRVSPMRTPAPVPTAPHPALAPPAPVPAVSPPANAGAGDPPRRMRQSTEPVDLTVVPVRGSSLEALAEQLPGNKRGSAASAAAQEKLRLLVKDLKDLGVEVEELRVPSSSDIGAEEPQNMPSRDSSHLMQQETPWADRLDDTAREITIAQQPPRISLKVPPELTLGADSEADTLPTSTSGEGLRFQLLGADGLAAAASMDSYLVVRLTGVGAPSGSVRTSAVKKSSSPRWHCRKPAGDREKYTLGLRVRPGVVFEVWGGGRGGDSKLYAAELSEAELRAGCGGGVQRLRLSPVGRAAEQGMSGDPWLLVGWDMADPEQRASDFVREQTVGWEEQREDTAAELSTQSSVAHTGPSAESIPTSPSGPGVRFLLFGADGLPETADPFLVARLTGPRAPSGSVRTPAQTKVACPRWNCRAPDTDGLWYACAGVGVRFEVWDKAGSEEPMCCVEVAEAQLRAWAGRGLRRLRLVGRNRSRPEWLHVSWELSGEPVGAATADAAAEPADSAADDAEPPVSSGSAPEPPANPPAAETLPIVNSGPGLRFDLKGAEGLPRAEGATGLSDPYLMVKLTGPGAPSGFVKTAVRKKTLSPQWDCRAPHKLEYRYELGRTRVGLRFEVWNWDRFGENEVVGVAEVSEAVLRSGSGRVRRLRLVPPSERGRSKRQPTDDLQRDGPALMVSWTLLDGEGLADPSRKPSLRMLPLCTLGATEEQSEELPGPNNTTFSREPTSMTCGVSDGKKLPLASPIEAAIPTALSTPDPTMSAELYDVADRLVQRHGAIDQISGRSKAPFIRPLLLALARACGSGGYATVAAEASAFAAPLQLASNFSDAGSVCSERHRGSTSQPPASPKSGSAPVAWTDPVRGESVMLSRLSKRFGTDALQVNLGSGQPRPFRNLVWDGGGGLELPDLRLSVHLPQGKALFNLIASIREIAESSGTKHNIPQAWEQEAPSLVLVRRSTSEDFGFSVSESGGRLVIKPETLPGSPADATGMGRYSGHSLLCVDDVPVRTSGAVAAAMEGKELVRLRLSRAFALPPQQQALARHTDDFSAGQLVTGQERGPGRVVEVAKDSVKVRHFGEKKSNTYKIRHLTAGKLQPGSTSEDLTVHKGIGGELGVTWVGSTAQVREVTVGGALERAGGSGMVGRTVVQCAHEDVSSAGDVLRLSLSVEQVVLTFSPPDASAANSAPETPTHRAATGLPPRAEVWSTWVSEKAVTPGVAYM
eukprot:TRINITY_DN4390_c0_g2_i1.p1 TRINITY_DN4390_c0_g2~~TRINITY_DN4390_c0_g2_i1.p1  ORF type:complete len:1532 (+),score=475.21 TRINITY_DN4390_c0_g2_i1:42-4598(+)